MIRKWGARARRPRPPSSVQKLEHEHAPGRGHEADLERIHEYVDRSLMLVTTLAQVIGHDKASRLPSK